MNKILIFPGSFQAVKNYGNYDGLNIWTKSFPDGLPAADFYIGHSLGINFILKHYNSTKNGKFIFINPQIRKRGLFSLFMSWLSFFFREGIKWKKIIPVKSWPFGIKKLLELLKVDVLSIMKKIPKENLVIIKGEYDNYFCDKKSVKILKDNDFKVIEVNAGHDWNDNIAQVVKSYIV